MPGRRHRLAGTKPVCATGGKGGGGACWRVPGGQTLRISQKPQRPRGWGAAVPSAYSGVGWLRSGPGSDRRQQPWDRQLSRPLSLNLNPGQAGGEMTEQLSGSARPGPEGPMLCPPQPEGLKPSRSRAALSLRPGPHGLCAHPRPTRPAAIPRQDARGAGTVPVGGVCCPGRGPLAWLRVAWRRPPSSPRGRGDSGAAHPLHLPSRHLRSPSAGVRNARTFWSLSLQPHWDALRVGEGAWSRLSPPGGPEQRKREPPALRACPSRASSLWRLYEGAAASKERGVC